MQHQRGTVVAAIKQKEDDLPDILTGIVVQQKSLRTWVQKALAYYERRNFENFVLLLEEAIAGCLRTYSSYKDDLARANVLLAAHFTMQAYKELGSRQTALQAKVTNIIRLLDGMNRQDDRHLLVVRGYALMLTPGRAQEADAHFVTVLRQMPGYIPALLGRGCLAYNRQDYIGALGYYKSVLMHQPSGPADVRVGIAHCFLKLGNLDSARRSFELALQHNGRCQNALLGIAILKLNKCEKAPVREGINLLCAAYELNNRHPAVLSILSFHYYYVRDYKSASTLAGSGYLFTDIAQLQSQNCFQIARTFHAMKQYDQATDFYTLSVKLAPDGYVLPKYGLAQMHLRRGEQDKAQVSLESFLKVLPNQIDATRLLAKIYLAENKVDEAIKLLRKAVESRCSSSLRDFDSWLSLALAYEKKQNWKHAIDAYRRAMRIYSGRGVQCPIEWLNNVAVIQKMAKLPHQALESIDEALALNGAKGGDHKETNMLTLRFNRGRILEDLHRSDLAAIAYKDLLADYPSYGDCNLRLGVMALRQNDLTGALDYFKDVLKYDNESVAARISLCNIYVSMGLTTQAMYCLNVVLNSHEKIDSYSLVSLGNVCLRNVYRYLIKGDMSAVERHQGNGLAFFAKALDQDPRNLWAANGIGAILSSRHRNDASEVFKQIAEVGKQCPGSAILNMAHMALELGKHQDAIDAYQRCLQHTSLQNSVEVMMGLAKAFYLVGNAIASKMWLSRARHLMPQDPVVMHNLGLAIQGVAEQMLVQPGVKSEDLLKAQLELLVAYGYFDYFSTCISHPKESVKKASRQVDKGLSLLAKLPVELERVRDLEALSAERNRLQAELQKNEREELEQERLQREQEMLKRQAVLDRTKKLLKEPNENTSQKEKGHRSKKNEEGKEQDAKKRKRSAGKTYRWAKKQKAKEVGKHKSMEFIDSDESGSASETASPTNRNPQTESVRPKMFKNKPDRRTIYTSSEASEDQEMAEREESYSNQQMDVEFDIEQLENYPFLDLQKNDNLTPEMTIKYMQELQRRMQGSTNGSV